MCLQVEIKPCHGRWRAPGLLLLLLLLALATAAAVVGGLLGFSHSPPQVRLFSGPRQRLTVGRRRPALQWGQGREQTSETQRSGGSEPCSWAGGVLRQTQPGQRPPASHSGPSADAPPEPPEPRHAPVQPNRAGGCGSECGNHLGDSSPEQPQLGSAIRRAESEWTGRAGCRGGGAGVQVTLPHLPACPGLRLLPALGAPGLLPAPDGTPRP